MRLGLEFFDERQDQPVELAAERMLGIGPHVLEERRGGCGDLLHHVGIGAVEAQDGRQLVADFFANGGQHLRLVDRLVDRSQEVIEQRAMAACAHERAKRADGERGQIERLQAADDLLREIAPHAGILGGVDRLREQFDDEARKLGASLAVGEPVGHERCEVDAAQFCLDRRCIEKVALDEFAEFFRDPELIGRDDRRVRDRQAERPAKQRDHRVPVGKPADGGGFRKGRQEAEGHVPRLHDLREHCNDETGDQHRRGDRLHAAQFGRARRIGRVRQEPLLSRHRQIPASRRLEGR